MELSTQFQADLLIGVVTWNRGWGCVLKVYFKKFSAIPWLSRN